MPDEPDKPGAKPEAPSSAGEPEGDRPTVSPPFDPITFARDLLASNPPAEPAPSEEREKVTAPPEGVANTAVTAPPPPGVMTPATRTPAPQSAPRRHTPVSTLSFLNARMPSNLPPIVAQRPPARFESTRLNAVDNEWAELELATRPPPADGPGEHPEVEITAPAHPPSDLPIVFAAEAPPIDDLGVETVRRPAPPEPAKPRDVEMTDRVSLGDYSGALEIAEQILKDNPRDASAKACAENCRTVLRQMYATRIGPLERVPVVLVPRDQLRWLSIDHKAGFVLSLVDGVSSVEMILDVGGMPELDTLRILSELAQQRIIALR
jgi:hypothetical protein